jgi:alkylhydroperoxidase family enzyme
MRINVPETHQSNPVAYVAKTFAPSIVAAGMGYSTVAYQTSRLSLREFEGARARTAEINGCRVCRSFRAARDLPGFFRSFGGDASASILTHGPAPDEAFYENVSNWKSYPRFSERERLAIAYAEGMGLAPQVVAADDELWGRMKAAFTDDEIVDLTYCIGAWIGLGRATHVLGLDGVCSFDSESRAVA